MMGSDGQFVMDLMNSLKDLYIFEIMHMCGFLHVSAIPSEARERL